MAVQPQWNLDNTTSSAVSISSGILRAATSDNIQPLAILACERFGATIAMCQETCRRIETAVLPTPPHAVLRFLGGVVGFSVNDCATQLGSTLAGLKFLGLAASLVTALRPFDGATALLMMLESSATDATQLPTTTQLKDLLASLDARLHRSGFADTVLGWQLMLGCIPALSRELSEKLQMGLDNRNRTRSGSYAPSIEAIHKLVATFRELHRIGAATAIKATIDVTSCAPWVIAFSKWCLGIPPSVYMDDGTPVVEQQGSRVTVVVHTQADSPNERLVIKIEHSIGGTEELLAADTHEPWVGMVTIERYGLWRLEELNLGRQSALRAIRQCLPCVVKLVLERLKFQNILAFKHAQRQRTSVSDTTLSEFIAVPFRGDRAALEILSRMVNMDVTPGFEDLESSISITDFPLVQAHLATLAAACDCDTCNAGSVGKVGRCSGATFLHNVATFVADVIALSLFHDSEPLLVYLHNSEPKQCRFDDIVYSIIMSKDSDIFNLTPPSVLNWALLLVGHENKKDDGVHCWAMSCFKGQAVYPTIFDTCRILKEGYLGLSWVSGTLKLSGNRHELVMARSWMPYFSPAPSDKQFPPQEVRVPLNALPGHGIDWKVTEYDGFLELGVAIQGYPLQSQIFQLNPAHVLWQLGRTLILERCRHRADAPLKEADSSSIYTTPLCLPTNDRKINVVAVDSADQLRFYTLSGIKYGSLVLRINACLQCSLDLCRNAGCNVLVL